MEQVEIWGEEGEHSKTWEERYKAGMGHTQSMVHKWEEVTCTA